MKALPLAPLLGLAAILTACGGEKAQGDQTDAINQTAGNSSAAAMPADAAQKRAKGTGTVTAIDTKAGTVTLDHGPIAEANWPAMTMMMFKADPQLLGGLKPGDKVAFEVVYEPAPIEITAISKQ